MCCSNLQTGRVYVLPMGRRCHSLTPIKEQPGFLVGAGPLKPKTLPATQLPAMLRSALLALALATYLAAAKIITDVSVPAVIKKGESFQVVFKTEGSLSGPEYCKSCLQNHEMWIWNLS